MEINFYPSTPLFQNIVRELKTKHDFKGLDSDGNSIYKHDTPYPTVIFDGSVKIHGTNAGIVITKTNDTYDIKFLSRERELSLLKDNYRFMSYYYSKTLDCLKRMVVEDNIPYTFFGEWCGKGIQDTVAISQLDKKIFVVFAVQKGDIWLNNFLDLQDESENIYNKYMFGTYKLYIDLERAGYYEKQLVDTTLSVEESCPVGKFFGIEGIGEGIVWETITENGKRIVFKTKGEKHSKSKVNKVRTSAEPEMLQKIDDFVSIVVNQNRLMQGLKEINKPTISVEYIGDFIRWVMNDIVKEEGLLMSENGFEFKKISSSLSAAIRKWYLEYLQNN